MLRMNLTYALRKLWRNKQFSGINVVGLTIGMAVFFIISEYLFSEWNANRFLKDYGQLYRAGFQFAEGQTGYYVPPGLTPLVKDKVTGVQRVCRLADGIGSGVISASSTEVFREDNIAYADSNVFGVLSFPLIAGTASLTAPGTAAISEPISKKLFGSANAIGKSITVNNQFGKTIYTVNAVYKDMPDESDIHPPILLSLQTLENKANRDDNEWADPNTLDASYAQLYVKLEPSASAKNVASELTAIYHKAQPSHAKDQLILQPFRHLHLAPTFSYPMQTFGSLVMVVVFAAIAVLILIIAWFNYINLSTAMALKSAGEVGVKKVLGASRIQIASQFLWQTIVIAALSVGLALLIVGQLQNFINGFLQKNLSLSLLLNWKFLVTGLVLLIVICLLSGSYVAFALSSFTPMKTLRGQADRIAKGISLRKTLVVFQFTASIVLIIGAIALYKQLNYMQDSGLGMNLKQLIVIKGPTVSNEGQAERNAGFKQDVGMFSWVDKISASNNVPGQGYNFSADGITGSNPQKGDERKSYSMLICDQNFFDAYGISFVQGHGFSQNDAEASWNNIKKVIINEKAAVALGFDLKKTVAGRKILWGVPYEVIGVVKDYHHLSLKEDIKPTIYLGSVSFGYFSIRTDTRHLPSKLKEIQLKYASFFPGNPFEYFFADEVFGNQYGKEQKLGYLLLIAAGIAIFIACLGLFGLASFSTQQRVKEIGMRKVLGAGLRDIVLLLSGDFIRLIFVAILVSLPIAYWAVDKWLQDFAYRTNLSWWLFALAGSIALIVAIGTIATQAIRAAVRNPVKNLRAD